MPGFGDLLGSLVKQVIGTAEEQLRAQAARERVRSARENGEEVGGFGITASSVDTEPSFVAAPGTILWSRGAYCYSASSHGTEGDLPLPATPEQVAALDRFMTAFPF
jgi:hypothetical protein